MEERTLIGRWEITIAKAVDSARWNHAATEDDEAWQIAALGAKSEGRPRTHAWAALQARPAMEEVIRVRVLREVGDHRPDDREIIHAGCNIGEQIAYR